MTIQTEPRKDLDNRQLSLEHLKNFPSGLSQVLKNSNK